MLMPVYLRSFEKEVEQAKKRGYDFDILKEVMTKLIEEKPLSLKHRKSQIKGQFYWILVVSHHSRLAACV